MKFQVLNVAQASVCLSRLLLFKQHLPIYVFWKSASGLDEMNTTVTMIMMMMMMMMMMMILLLLLLLLLN